jgi:hypothetical protein
MNDKEKLEAIKKLMDRYTKKNAGPGYTRLSHFYEVFPKIWQILES